MSGPAPVRVNVRLTPRAARCQVASYEAGLLTVRVTSPPVDNAANDACVETIAAALGIRPSRVEIVGGHHSRNKTVAIDGLTEEAVDRLLTTAAKG